jgi:hypothetical protein
MADIMKKLSATRAVSLSTNGLDVSRWLSRQQKHHFRTHSARSKGKFIRSAAPYIKITTLVLGKDKRLLLPAEWHHR